MRRKENELIRMLLSVSEPVPSRKIAEKLQITSRSVKNYVKSINGFYDKPIIQSSRSGYSIHPQAVSLLSSREDDDEIPDSLEERIAYVMKELIAGHTSGIDLFDLADDLCVSYSTVKALVVRMNRIYKSYNVRFITKNDVLMMEGKEEDKRKMISHVINEELSSSIVNRTTLDDYFSNIDINELMHIISDTFKTYHYYLNDFATMNLLLHMAIIIDRNLSGKRIENLSQDIESEDPREQEFMMALYSRLEQQFDVVLNPYEKYEIYMMFKANANSTLVSLEKDLNHVVGQEIIDLTNHYISEIQNQYLIDLSSETFKTAFALHLKNLIFRASHGRSAPNPMLASIRNNSPLIFDISVYVALDLMDRYNIIINEDEVAFLAIHIGSEIERQNINQSKLSAILLCPDYLDLQERTLNELMLRFSSQIDIIHTVSNTAELSDLLDAGVKPNVLLSAIPIEANTGCRVIEYTPLNLKDQFDRIQSILTDLLDERKTESLKTDFKQYFEPDLFVVCNKDEVKETLLHDLCRRLIEKNYVNKDFETHVMEREKAATTAFGSIAIPHSVMMDAMKTSVATAVSNDGIVWDDNHVNIVLLIAINNADKHIFRNLFESLVAIFSNEDVLRKARTCNSFEEFEQLIYTSTETNEND